jgi:hypothetical protein
MSSRRTSSVPKADVVFPRMLYCDSRCSQTLTTLSLALPGALLCNATRRLGDGQRVILRQRVRGSVRAVRAVRNTRVFQTESGVVADDMIYIEKMQLWMRSYVLLSNLRSNQYSLHHCEKSPIVGVDSQKLKEYCLYCKSETWRGKTIQNSIFYVYIILRYDQNLNI